MQLNINNTCECIKYKDYYNHSTVLSKLTFNIDETHKLTIIRIYYSHFSFECRINNEQIVSTKFFLN